LEIITEKMGKLILFIQDRIGARWGVIIPGIPIGVENDYFVCGCDV